MITRPTAPASTSGGRAAAAAGSQRGRATLIPLLRPMTTTSVARTSTTVTMMRGATEDMLCCRYGKVTNAPSITP